ncbi:hypothetical protein EDB87DRAFT_1573697 [Lactarius vividus]|nr:hypothetical protein EDB87DRAFT_1573697 [Lactarius vividus]
MSGKRDSTRCTDHEVRTGQVTAANALVEAIILATDISEGSRQRVMLIARGLVVVREVTTEDDLGLGQRLGTKRTMSLRNSIEKRAQEPIETPNSGGSGGSSQGAERSNEALITGIQSLEQEKDANVVIITVSAISASLVWCILRSIPILQAARATQKVKHYHDIYAAFLSHVPQTDSLASPRVAVPPIPYAPDPTLTSSGPDRLDLLWANVYWITSLVFGLSAIFMAVLIKKKIRHYRVVIQRRGRPPLEAQRQESLNRDAGAWYMFEETDTMYRLLQVSLLVIPLGHASYLYPLGATIFIPTVVSGLLYVFGVIGPTVRPEQPPQSPSPD